MIPRDLMLNFLCGLSIACLASLSFAQNLPQIVTEPWLEGTHWSETYDDVVVLEQSHTRRAGQDVNLWVWDSNGRVRANRNNPDPSVVFGYRILSCDVGSPVNALDGSFWDITIVGGTKLADLDED